MFNYFRATSKVDSGHTFLTYSHFPGAYGDKLKRLCGDAAKNLKLFSSNIKSRFWEHIPNIFSFSRGIWR